MMTSTPSPKPLRDELREVVSTRRHLIRTGQSKRTDLHGVEASLHIADRFLASWPHADDARVVEWVQKFAVHVSRILTPTNGRRLQKIMMGELNWQEQIAVVQDDIRSAPAPVIDLFHDQNAI
jgi:hypothetical protein